MITATFNDGGLRLNLAQAPAVTGLQLQKFAFGLGNHMVAAVARNIAPGALIGRRTGDLARALTFTVDAGGGVFVVEIFPDPAKVPYGAIQEFGGTIIPSRAQALTIPLPAMLTGNGVARGTAAAVREDPGAFGFTATFIPKGHSVIMGKTSDGSIVPLFALARSVTIPARSYLATTLIQEYAWIADYLERITQETVAIVFGERAFAA